MLRNNVYPAVFRLTVFIILHNVHLLIAQGKEPVAPDPSPEAVELLQYLYRISGQHTLSGQHCAPLTGSTRLSVVHRNTGRYPALFGQDFGFSFPGYWDGINYRQRIVDEAIRRHQEGFVISLMWHAVRPTDDEPVTFMGSVRADGKRPGLTKKEWEDLVTPGTHLHERWKSQVDVIAWFLKQLRYAGVPVLWRPYHEMNGGWFWWGKKKGENGYRKLYRNLFDRLVHFHGLNNLIWVYNANEVKPGVDRYDKYYPGDDVVDILATDVYTTGFNRKNYEQLLALANGKPIALGEVGDTPDGDVLREQPAWTWFMRWEDGPGGRQGKVFKDLMASEQVLTLEELPGNEERERVRIHHPVLKN